MIRIFGVAFVFAILVTSCSTEKINLSPISDSIVNDMSSTGDVGVKSEAVTYQSELTNLMSTFPKFRNTAVNREVQQLKTSITSYISADLRKDKKAQKSAYKDFSDSYKKIQKLRKYMNADEDEVLNRYLVRIKTNINLLESLN
ncbi:hypothetical protein SAMN05421847_1045 [Halpernia humi]|uniref:Uncharacterized protein n=1 Tax=Halpernia humi TaxID=493375 RepID=A0A1H5VYW0_9FLAO|nr:hypothetical protein [Halpernia humi]SEF92313.1 hypothetical protein SAMN05421847_1045 [Halpernia humi]